MEELLRLGNAPGGEGGGLGLFIHHVIGVEIGVLLLLVVHLDHHLLFEPGHQHLGHVVELGGLLPLTGDDQGRPGLVDEDGVYLVHDGEGVAPLHQLLGVDAHVVPQVVEAHLVVGAVGDVGGVGPLAGGLVHVVDDEAHGEAQEAVDLAHPLALVLGQVVVDGDDVDPLARQGVEVGGEGGHQGLALAGLHFRDAPLVEDDAAHQLDAEGPHPQDADGGLPHSGKGLGQDVVQVLAVGEAPLELGGLGGELGVGQGLVFRLQGLDLIRDGVDLPQLPLAVGTKDFCDQTHYDKLLFRESEMHTTIQFTSITQFWYFAMGNSTKGAKRAAKGETGPGRRRAPPFSFLLRPRAGGRPPGRFACESRPAEAKIWGICPDRRRKNR